MSALQKLSKFLSFILRHKPQTMGIVLDKEGFAPVAKLVESGKFTIGQIESIVTTDEKNRYSFNEDKTMIRANQGHSTKEVEIDFAEAYPPPFLYHGTLKTTVPLILTTGIKKMARHHVHLSNDIETAINVGSRRGKCCVLKVEARSMNTDGYRFFLSDNGVWLVDFVPTKYISGEVA